MKDLLEKYSGNLSLQGESEPLQKEHAVLSLTEQVYEKLRNQILSGLLDPRQKLSAEDIALQMVVSIQYVREALVKLADESLVVFEASVGYSVARFTLDDLKEIYFLRGLLEGAASKIAANNLSEEELKQLENLCNSMTNCLDTDDLSEMPELNAAFHQIIYSSAKSPRLYKMITQLWNGFLKSSVSFLTLRAPIMVEEHRAIYEALNQRNPEEAKVKTQVHITSALKDLLEYWGQEE